MKPNKPLNNIVFDRTADGKRVYHEDDIASAVKWLRNNSCDSYDNCYLHNRELCPSCKLITEAFQDVIEDKK